MKKLVAAIVLLVGLLSLSVVADEQSSVNALHAAGATKVEQDKTGAVTSIFFKDSSKITSDQWKQIGQITSVKQVIFYNQCSLSDQTSPLLAGLINLEEFTSDGAQISDPAFAVMAQWKNLRKLTFFHTSSKVAFNGSGFAALVDLPKLESFSMGGAMFNDEGMATLARFPRLKDVRIWHTRVTPAGNIHLEAWSELKSLYYAPEARTTNQSIVHIAKLTKLEKLTLLETRFSATELEPLKSLVNLRSLTLDKVDISPSDLASVKSALPKVDIKWTEADEKALSGIRRAFEEKK